MVNFDPFQRLSFVVFLRQPFYHRTVSGHIRVTPHTKGHRRHCSVTTLIGIKMAIKTLHFIITRMDFMRERYRLRRFIPLVQ